MRSISNDIRVVGREFHLLWNAIDGDKSRARLLHAAVRRNEPNAETDLSTSPQQPVEITRDVGSCLQHANEQRDITDFLDEQHLGIE